MATTDQKGPERSGGPWGRIQAWPRAEWAYAALVVALFAMLVAAGLMPAWAAVGAASVLVVLRLVALRFARPPDTGTQVGEADALAERHSTLAQLAATAGGREEASQLLSAVAATLPDPFMVLDAHGIVILCNEHAVSAFEVDPTGQHISAAIRAPAILEAVEQVSETGEAQRVDYERRVPVERRFEAFVAAIPKAPPARGGTLGSPALLLLLRDLTRQHQVERMRADFVANASHELRTPLASVLGFIETLQGAARDDAKARAQFLELMRAQAERMSRLIDDLLSLSRIELNVHLRPTDTVDLGKAVRHVVEFLEPLARERGATLELSLSDGEVFVKGDRDELVQVFQNLIENAIKYAGSGGRIEIFAETSGTARGESTVSLSVRDHGPGIPAEHIPRLTERFYRVNVQDSRSKGGTGLGLAIVKHILNRHRGKLVVKSEVGVGSVFTARLPLAAPDSVAQPEHKAPNNRPKAKINQ
ncbi:phosphate regulon sensor histidine kinase PhoR [Kaustia mangrovi]|nr:phosphate regulon sensor histidine kinase PhoR [Kaustia mangrovi]